MAKAKSAKMGDNIGRDQLRGLVERIERVEESQKELAEDKKEIFAEAKSAGFDVKILRKVIARRKRDQAEVDEEQALFDVYCSALGMGPLFDDDAGS